MPGAQPIVSDPCVASETFCDVANPSSIYVVEINVWVTLCDARHGFDGSQNLFAPIVVFCLPWRAPFFDIVVGRLLGCHFPLVALTGAGRCRHHRDHCLRNLVANAFSRALGPCPNPYQGFLPPPCGK
jgi:hypothetical protein